jgi:glycosyltransferase involved in cell wall biosynthesis
MADPDVTSRLPEVVFFLPNLGGGGAEMNVVRVAQALPHHGFRATIAVSRGGGALERLVDPQTDFRVLVERQVKSSTLGLIRTMTPLRRLLRERQPAILCPVMDVPSQVALLAVRGVEPRPKVVLSIQNSLRAKFIDHGGLPQKLQLPLLKKLYPAADHVLALSTGVAEELRELIPALGSKISVIHNAGPDAEDRAAAPATIARPESGKLIVACGRLVEQKGYPYLLQAFAQLLETEDAHLWILGDGPDRQALQALAQSLSLDGRVRFLGFQNDPGAYMGAADVFVLSSLWEGFANVVVEAMSTGTAVVATDCPHGPGEIITHERNGLLVPPGDAAGLAQGLRRMLRDEALRRRLGAAGQERSHDFLPDAVARQYAGVFARLLSSGTEVPGRG